MNPRIIELLTPKLKEWGGASGDNFSRELEQFAQLLIQECAELTLSHRNDDYYNGWLDYRDEIRRHFGIQE